MSRFLAALLAFVFVVVLAVLVLWMTTVAGLGLCSDPQRLSDDCIDASGGERALGLVLGFSSLAAAAATVVLAAIHVRRGRGGRWAPVTAVLTPVLAVVSLFFLPISF